MVKLTEEAKDRIKRGLPLIHPGSLRPYRESNKTEGTMKTDDELINVLTQRASLVLTRTGIKHDNGKPVVSLIDPDWLLEVAEVLTFGAEKYSPDNWKQVDNARERYLSAAYRHLLAYQKGLENDSESNLSHLAHASCCLMFLHYLENNKNE